MSIIKKKAAAVATVKNILESNINNDLSINSTNANNWSLWGKQTVMINRNISQMRPKQRLNK